MKSFLIILAIFASCGTTELTAEKSVVWQRRPGATCYVRLVLDGGDKTVEVEAPFPCPPDPAFCERGPGETP